MHIAEQSPLLGAMTEEEQRQVRIQLERLLGSHQFRNSRRYPALLRFLVEEELGGRGDLLKERLIGIQVFGRPADYDTATDPIVRVTIAEIRRRIAQYYHDEEHDAEIRIELMTGRYAPEFRLRRESRPVEELTAPATAIRMNEPQASAALPAVSALVPARRPEAALDVPLPARRRHVLTVPALSVALVLMLALGCFFGLRWLRPSALDQFWMPILAPRQTVLFCLPTDVGRKKPSAKPVRPTVAAKVSGPTFLDHESLGENIVYSDMLAMMNIANVLTAHHADYRIRLNVATTLDDLRHGPSILIGGLDNEWTLRAIEKLPYRFAGSDEESYWISDVRDPGNRSRSLDLKVQYAAVTRDYALIARLHNDQTGEPEVIVAGIGMSGTAAAGEMIGDEQLMQEVRRRVGAGYKDHDFEVVVSTDVVNGNAGSPKILAVSVW